MYLSILNNFNNKKLKNYHFDNIFICMILPLLISNVTTNKILFNNKNYQDIIYKLNWCFFFCKLYSYLY